ncbi:hypothetical protein [Reichenbachiella sp. MALMAid0571]|uniref:hypothetical protein n=1 Tax=Reichenbachiella sp. MALMAid0571 TaxID=3143939 RepID=UPI0032DE48E9
MDVINSVKSISISCLLYGLVFSLLIHTSSNAQQSKNQSISINFENVNTIQALEQISAISDFNLSYNPDVIQVHQNINKSYSNTPIELVLNDLLGNQIELKYRGSYIIIQRVQPAIQTKNKFKIAGDIKDAETGETIKGVTVYEVNKLNSTLSDDRGNFELSVSAKSDYVTFAVSRANYKDTIIRVPKELNFNRELYLNPVTDKPEKKITFFKDVEAKLKEIETKKLVQFFTSKKERENSKNIGLIEEKDFQFSFIPSIGTNMQMGGQIKNRYSFNLLAGYSYGLSVFELGGLYNIDRKEVAGLQIAGFGNAVGEIVKGTQVAGFINTNKSYTAGMQLSGFLNVVADDMKGIQLSGFNNISENTTGSQITGFINISSKKMQGLQLAGFTNIAADLEGAQISGFYNKAKEMDGFQLAGFVNHAKTVKGIQLSVVNIADSVASGATIGLFNFVKKGLHQLSLSHNDVTDVNLEFRGGSNAFYSILSSGIQIREDYIWSYGLGFGRQYKIVKSFFSNIELSSHVLSSKSSSFENMNLLNKLNLNFGYQFAPHLSLNMGPTLNIYVSNALNEDTQEYGYDIVKNPVFSKKYDSSGLSIWLGYSASLKF